jgi:type IV secretion system protein VirB1
MIKHFLWMAVALYVLHSVHYACAGDYDQNFMFLAQQCAPDVHQDTMRRIVNTESSFNPYAIGVVGGHLERQPHSREEAIATAQWLEQNGFNYSVGLAQVNKKNFASYGLTLQTAFETCPNLKAGGAILKDCFIRAKKINSNEQEALRDAFSCYYSGNFITGYKQGYVQKIVGSSQKNRPIKIVSDLKKSEILEKSPVPIPEKGPTEASYPTQSALLF